MIWQDALDLSSVGLVFGHSVCIPLMLLTHIPRTNVFEHDVDLGNTRSLKQYQYHINPIKVQFMLDQTIIEQGQSSLAFPRLLVLVPDGSIIYCRL